MHAEEDEQPKQKYVHPIISINGRQAQRRHPAFRHALMELLSLGQVSTAGRPSGRLGQAGGGLYCVNTPCHG